LGAYLTALNLCHTDY